jgi:fermentation-respiration switch protein FrsA (DUF1100 family)
LKTPSFEPTAHRRLASRIAGVVLFLGFAWIGAVLFLATAQSSLLFMTGESREFTRPFDGAIFRQSAFSSADGLRLESVLLIHDSDPNRRWILFYLPAGASIRVARIQEHLQELWTFGYNVLAFDYRGFGANSGTPTEEGLYADATAAYQSLTDVYGVSPSQIIVAGRSLGASVAVDLVTRLPTGGLVLFSPIDSVPAAAARLYPWAPVRLLARYHFDNTVKSKSIDVPLLFVYGSRDSYLPRADARALFQRFRGRKKIIETSGGHHHSGFIVPRELWQALDELWPPMTT